MMLLLATDASASGAFFPLPLLSGRDSFSLFPSPGANLTLASHAIFISPLLTFTSQEYRAKETQAIGRIKRSVKLTHMQLFRDLVEFAPPIDSDN